MTSILIRAVAFLAFVFSAPAFAAPQTYIWAEGRFTRHSPGNYSSTTADLAVNLRADLPYGSTVRVIYGFGGEGSDWLGRKDIEAVAVAPWEWRAAFSETLHERSWDRAYTKLEFVFQITQPDGTVRYEKGGDSTFGFFEAALPEPGTIGTETAEMTRLLVYTIQRN